MAKFITRVELHKQISEDYETLHATMKNAGFKKSIPANDGKEYALPSAEYYIEGVYTLAYVFDAANKAATSTGKKFWIITSEINYATFELNPISK